MHLRLGKIAEMLTTLTVVYYLIELDLTTALHFVKSQS